MLTTTLLATETLIGKTIAADGWLRDNGGFISGEIVEVKPIYNGLEYQVRVVPDTANSMETYTFKGGQMATLLRDGFLPEANKFLNSGTNARIIC